MRKLAPLKVATIFLACLYDYGSRLVKVIDLGMPVVRIASDRRSNTLYAIGLNPDYMLVKYWGFDMKIVEVIVENAGNNLKP